MSTTADVLRRLVWPIHALPSRIAEARQILGDPDAKQRARDSIAELVATVDAANTPALRRDLAAYPLAVRPWREVRDVAAFCRKLLALPEPTIGDGGPFAGTTRENLAAEMDSIARELLRIADELDLLPPAADASPAAGDPVNATSAGSKPIRKQRRGDWVPRAMLLIRDHPEWPDSRIAMEVGVVPSTVSRSGLYRRAATLARGPAVARSAVDDSLNLNRKASRQSEPELDLDDQIDRDMANAKSNATRKSKTRGKS